MRPVAEWTFLTNHGLVLSYIAQNLQSTVREIANAIGITERTAHKIISDLETAGYISRTKSGRRNTYRIHAELPLRHATQRDVAIGHLLQTLASSRRRRRSA